MIEGIVMGTTLVDDRDLVMAAVVVRGRRGTPAQELMFPAAAVMIAAATMRKKTLIPPSTYPIALTEVVDVSGLKIPVLILCMRRYKICSLDGERLVGCSAGLLEIYSVVVVVMTTTAEGVVEGNDDTKHTRTDALMT